MTDRPGYERLAPGVWIPVDAIQWSQSRSSGPGGQNVNKTESKAELRLDVRTIEGLSLRAQDRFIELAGSRLGEDMTLLITCDETRSLRQNRELALERLRDLTIEAQAVPKPRRATKPSRGAVRRRLETKRHTSDKKQDRRTTGD